MFNAYFLGQLPGHSGPLGTFKAVSWDLGRWSKLQCFNVLAEAGSRHCYFVKDCFGTLPEGRPMSFVLMLCASTFLATRESLPLGFLITARTAQERMASRKFGL